MHNAARTCSVESTKSACSVARGACWQLDAVEAPDQDVVVQCHVWGFDGEGVSLVCHTSVPLICLSSSVSGCGVWKDSERGVGYT